MSHSCDELHEWGTRQKACSTKAGPAFTQLNRSLVVTAAAMTAGVALKSGAMFTIWTVACVADVALAIVRLIRVEVGERLFVALRHWSVVTVVRIVAVIDVAVEAVRAMEPGASSDEHPASKPIRPIVAIGSAVIGGVVKVTVRAHGRRSDVNGNLSWCHRHAAHQCNSESKEGKRLPSGHIFSPLIPKNLESQEELRVVFSSVLHSIQIQSVSCSAR